MVFVIVLINIDFKRFHPNLDEKLFFIRPELSNHEKSLTQERRKQKKKLEGKVNRRTSNQNIKKRKIYSSSKEENFFILCGCFMAVTAFKRIATLTRQREEVNGKRKKKTIVEHVYDKFTG